MARIPSKSNSHKMSTLRNLTTSILLYESIVTTKSNAKIIKPFLERLISRSKKNDLSARRYANSVVYDKNASDKLFMELLKRYANRNSGFVRIINKNKRLGDNADMVVVELIDKKVFIDTEKDTNKSSKIDEKAK